MRCRMFISEISLIFHQKNSEERMYDRSILVRFDWKINIIRGQGTVYISLIVDVCDRIYDYWYGRRYSRSYVCKETFCSLLKLIWNSIVSRDASIVEKRKSCFASFACSSLLSRLVWDGYLGNSHEFFQCSSIVTTLFKEKRHLS